MFCVVALLITQFSTRDPWPYPSLVIQVVARFLPCTARFWSWTPRTSVMLIIDAIAAPHMITEPSGVVMIDAPSWLPPGCSPRRIVNAFGVIALLILYLPIGK